MYEINVEPKVPAIDVHRSVPISGEITLNAPEFSKSDNFIVEVV